MRVSESARAAAQWTVENPRHTFAEVSERIQAAIDSEVERAHQEACLNVGNAAIETARKHHAEVAQYRPAVVAERMNALKAEIAELVEALRDMESMLSASTAGNKSRPKVRAQARALLSRYQSQENPVSSTNRKKESSK